MIGDLVNVNAALLVFGGTFAAVIIGTPGRTLASARRRCIGLFRRQLDPRREIAEQIMRCATLARRLGVSSMEAEAEALDNLLLRRALLLVVDGAGPNEVGRQIQIEIAAEEEKAETDALVFEQAGGYAPTIGIIGAVVGLIHVMRQLGDVDAVGRGIAAAFTATLYGVALANLILLPIAARMRARARSAGAAGDLVLEGVTALSEDLSPRTIRTRLDALLESGDGLSLKPDPPAGLSVVERMSA